MTKKTMTFDFDVLSQAYVHAWEDANKSRATAFHSFAYRMGHLMLKGENCWFTLHNSDGKIFAHFENMDEAFCFIRDEYMEQIFPTL